MSSRDAAIAACARDHEWTIKRGRSLGKISGGAPKFPILSRRLVETGVGFPTSNPKLKAPRPHHMAEHSAKRVRSRIDGGKPREPSAAAVLPHLFHSWKT